MDGWRNELSWHEGKSNRKWVTSVLTNGATNSISGVNVLWLPERAFTISIPFFCGDISHPMLSMFPRVQLKATSLYNISILFNTEADIRLETPKLLCYYWCIAVNVNIASMNLDTMKLLRKYNLAFSCHCWDPYVPCVQLGFYLHLLMLAWQS